MTAGGYHNMALRPDGSIAAWGNDDSGQVSQTPAEGGFIAVAGGGFHSLALRADGSLAAWGFNSHGQVSATPTGTGLIAVSAGNHYSLALRADGSLVAWGYGQPNPPAQRLVLRLRARPDPGHQRPVRCAGVHDAGQPLPGERVTFSMGGRSCSATTDSNGDASCSLSLITALLNPGSYTASYAGSSASAPSSATGRITLL